jgi:flagellar P-ring protein precursor FlgI
MKDVMLLVALFIGLGGMAKAAEVSPDPTAPGLGDGGRGMLPAPGGQGAGQSSTAPAGAPFYVQPTGALTRIKDIVSVGGVRANQLVGYGLVIGLNGTGDSLRNSPFTDQSLKSMLDRMGVNVRSAQSKSRNIAAVIITAELPAFIGRGSRIDVTVSSLGDATSLVGGSLVMTPLSGPDSQIYAVAQGPVAVSGFSVGGAAESVTQNVPTSARIPNGALVEREPPSRFGEDKYLILELRNPDFATAVRVADVINSYSLQRYGARSAQERDLRTVTLMKPGRVGAARFLAEIGSLAVQADSPARVVVDERTGTIVIGNDVRISTVAVAHGNLTVRVTEAPLASQPLPFSEGETVILPQTQVTADQADGKVAVVEGANLQMLVSGLNRMGLKPASVIAILQAIKSAGALQADLVVQ